MTNVCSTCNNPIAHDNLITACEQLAREGHPVPMIHCGCGNLIWRRGRFEKCAGCGRKEAGHLVLVGGADPSWKAVCERAQERLDELLGRVKSLEYCCCPSKHRAIF